jgi:uncharacterized protein YgiM (DUF1202 family)
MEIEIIKPHLSEFPEPISFDAGETVHVDREDPKGPGWFWCRVSSGQQGWVHQSFLETTQATTTALRSYSAAELTVAAGEHGTLLSQCGGWAYVRLCTGQKGWIPRTHLRLKKD